IVILSRDQMDNKRIKEVILHDKECPLSLIMFKVVKCRLEYIQVRKCLRARESNLDTIQTSSIQEMIIIDGVGVDRDHCTVHNQNSIVTKTAPSEVWLNGKLVLTLFVLQHGSLVYFGRNPTFPYCDSQLVHKTTMESPNLIQKK
ncbi:unnamed protein product, partial [Rotaria sp. Silwood1]